MWETPIRLKDNKKILARLVEVEESGLNLRTKKKVIAEEV